VVSLGKSLLIHQSIRTTQIKAEAAKPLVERLITLGKRDNLASRREAFSILQDHILVGLLFSDIAPLFNNRNGGYCRILPFGFRRGDGAKLVIFELTAKRKVEKKPIRKQEVRPEPKEEITEAPVKPPVRPPKDKKPTRRIFGGLKKIFKKERDSL
jgi:large subunit ribosomal protein L17